MNRWMKVGVMGALLWSLSMPATNAMSYSDVPKTHSNYYDILYLEEHDVIVDRASYGMQDIVTREEVAVMVAKAIGLDGSKPVDTKFKDVKKNNSNSGYIQAAVDAGIINGYTDNTFRSTTNVTRGHMAAFISRAFTLPTGTKTFKDVAKNNTAYAAVSQLAAANITTGYEDGTFKPQNNLTRAHISAFLARAMRYEAQTHTMEAHFIDVGQGDATLLQLATGENVLIDAGTDAAGETVVAYLQKQNVQTLDYVIATHPDADHIGGMVDVLKAFDVKHFVDSGKVHTTNTYKNMLQAVDAEGATFTVPNAGDMLIEHTDVHSYVQVLYANESAKETNDASLVVKGGFCSEDVLLMGDASADVEAQLVKQANVEADIVKLGHHGSNTSSSLSFLQAVKPNTAIISYGEGNSYGHPHKEVVANVHKVGASMYETAKQGHIVATIQCGSHTVDQQASTPVVPTPVVPTPTPAPVVPTSFANCTELRKVYPDGVKEGHVAYAAKLDGDSDGWACETTDSNDKPAPAPVPTPAPKPQPTGDVNSGSYVVPGAATSFKNCTAMREVYPKGVKTGHPAYAKKHDRDGDGWACE
ncbi:S-layer homology domain-containing protein [Caryophanon latum]|nr:S-layer homology domain-containing protein [Caryophanon latum]